MDAKTYKAAGVIRGASAGCLAALSLRKFCPELQITLIESSRALADEDDQPEFLKRSIAAE